MAELLGVLKWLAGFTLVLMVGLPAVTILTQFGGVALGEYHASQLRQDRDDEAEAFRKKYEHVVDFTEDVFSLKSYDKFGELVPSRLASVVLSFPKNRFGEGSLQSVLSAARLAAPEYAEKECEVLLSTIASKCRLSEAGASPLRGFIEIGVTLQFVQRAALGEVSGAPKLRLDKVEFEYGKDDRERIGLDQASRQMHKRSLIYSNIARDCTAVKGKYGNCSIGRIMIRSDVFGPQGKEFVRTTGNSSQSFMRALEES
jgi:hypothetical protein